MTILDLIQKQLQESNYDGLFNSDGECACLGDCPCGELSEECEFGYFQQLTDDDKEEFSYRIGRNKYEALERVVEKYKSDVSFKCALDGILLDAKIPLDLTLKEQILQLSSEQIDSLAKGNA